MQNETYLTPIIILYFPASKYKIQPFIFPEKIREGETTKVMCSVGTDEKTFSFKWFRNDVEIKSNDRIEISQHADFSLLKIKSILSQDSGNYTCVALSPQTVRNYSAVLLVEGKLEFK